MELGQWVINCCSLNKKMQKLKCKLDDLSSREVDIIHELEYAESRSLKKRKREVENWLASVKRKKEEVRIMEEAVEQRRLLLKRVQLVNCVEKLTEEVSELLDQGRFSEGLSLHTHEVRQDALFTVRLMGQTFHENKDKIMTCLMKDEFLSVGLYGMGGVGKTTLAMHIHNQLLEESKAFGPVYWVTVSKDFSIHKLQSNIAKMVSLDLSNEDDEKKRAAKLAQALMKRNKYVLILDDVWNHFLLEKVGIPVRVSGCKLILTTRSLDLCRRLGCGVNIKQEPLHKEEAWELFKKTLGQQNTLPCEVEYIARSVARECAGLPLGLITMAGSMRGVDDICEWRDALEKLKQSKSGQDSMETDVYQVLEISYRSLNNSNVQDCFLYCALYPEDYKIKREELIERFIDEGLTERMKSRRAELDRGHAILNKLENACLLEGVVDNFPYETKCVRMHDLVRDMALQIASSHPRFMVAAGSGLKDLPDEEKWAENLEKVSLMCNKISKIPLGASPNCPRLSTLMLQYNGLKRIPDSFFMHMLGLKVIDLSYTGIENLPCTISNLENLSALVLRECSELQYMPSLAKLTALKRLDLGNSGIKEIPRGMEMLVNLRYLDLHASNLDMLPTGILPRLSHLQYLIIYGLSKTLKVEGEEVASLVKLETFSGQFYDISNFNTYVKCLEEGGPTDYLLQVGLDNPYFSPIESGSFHRRVILKGCNISRSKERDDSLVLPTDVQYVYIQECHDIGSLCDISSLNTATDLKRLVINNCEGIHFVVSSLSSSYIPLHRLQSLRLAFLPNLHILIGERGVTKSATLLPGSFSSLKELRIYNCPKLEKLFLPQLLRHFQNLEELHIEDCVQMVEIVAAPTEEEEEEIYREREKGIIATSLPRLRVLELWNLAELRSICSKGVIVCDSLQHLAVRYCKKLKRIPLSLPLHDRQPSPPPSLQIIKAFPKDWWDSLVWEHPNAKNVLQPFCQFSRYL